MGLSERARKIVASEPVFVCTEETTRVYSDGRRETLEPREVFEPSVKTEKSGRFYQGMCGDKYSLDKYTLPDGRVMFEAVQDEPWSSGPVFFLALQDENGKWIPESLWTEEEIQAYL
jgi:hypothetical protein